MCANRAKVINFYNINKRNDRREGVNTDANRFAYLRSINTEFFRISANIGVDFFACLNLYDITIVVEVFADESTSFKTRDFDFVVCEIFRYKINIINSVWHQYQRSIKGIRIDMEEVFIQTHHKWWKIKKLKFIKINIKSDYPESDV